MKNTVPVTDQELLRVDWQGRLWIRIDNEMVDTGISGPAGVPVDMDYTLKLLRGVAVAYITGKPP